MSTNIKRVILTLHSHVALTNELLSESYKILMTGCFQSEPRERFFRYREMNGGSF